HFRRGVNFYYLNRLNEALETFKQALALQPNNIKYRFYLGKTLFKLKDYKQAIKELEPCLSLKEEANEVMTFLANAYFQVGDYNNAAKLYTIISKRRPDDFEAQLILGRINFESEPSNIQLAQRHFEQALKLEPRNSKPYYFIGRILMRENKFQEAIDYFNRAISFEITNAEYYYWRGNAYYAQMDFYSETEDGWRSYYDFRKAIELGYDPAQANFMFANTCLYRGLYYIEINRANESVELLKTAISHYRRVLANRFDASNAYNNMGLALLALNNVQEAVTAFKKAVEIEPTFAIFHNNLGDAYYRLGNFKDAITEWQLALELDPDPENKRTSLFGDRRPIREKIRDAERRR
ncbi:MAG TPA: tetratricopeptide repeat protein, partial [bacterium]|nr:tetratricopeptide repeat protein [bacterium]